MVIYEGREFSSCSLCTLLKREPKQEERYALLIQNEDIEAVMFLEHIEKVRMLRDRGYAFPTYMKESKLDDIKGCHLLKPGVIAYEIDLIKLLKAYFEE